LKSKHYVTHDDAMHDAKVNSIMELYVFVLFLFTFYANDSIQNCAFKTAND